MSQRELEAVIGRAILDQEFRMALFADPTAALAGYGLTREERTALLAVDAETLDAFAAQLEVHLARQAPRQPPVAEILVQRQDGGIGGVVVGAGFAVAVRVEVGERVQLERHGRAALDANRSATAAATSLAVSQADREG